MRLLLLAAGCVPLPGVDEVDWDGDGSAGAADCDDADPGVRRGAPEVVGDGVDQDCDGVEPCFRDADGDGFGDGTVVAGDDLACDGPQEAPAGRTLDCDDADDTVRPGAPEVDGDEVDQDCNGRERCFVDGDGDGARTAARVASDDPDCGDPGEAPEDRDVDCDDADPGAHPGAREAPDDGVDSDCDGNEDCYPDLDGDGARGRVAVESSSPTCRGPLDGRADDPVDCDDLAADVFPGAAEVPDDGIDQDCDRSDWCFADGDGDGARGDGPADPGDLDCADPGEAAETASVDCDDADPRRRPGAVEAPDDGVDQDCDGGDDCFVDLDGDGARSAASVPGADLDCDDPPEVRASAPPDCDDAAGDVFPGAPERVADDLDQDCDGVEWCRVDADLDGAPRPAGHVDSEDLACDGPGEAPADAEPDCDDADPARTPGARERLDRVDNDCDGETTVDAEDAVDVFFGRPDGARWGWSVVGCDLDGAGDRDLAYSGLDTSVALNTTEAQGLTLTRGGTGGVRHVACVATGAGERLGVASEGAVWLAPGPFDFAGPGLGVRALLEVPLPATAGCAARSGAPCAPTVRADLGPDGAAGFAVVAPGADELEADSGAVYVFSHGPAGAPTLAATVVGAPGEPGFGSDAAAPAGWLAVGDRARNRVVLVADPLDPRGAPGTLEGRPTGGAFGAVVRAGDLDGDGVDDLIVADPADDDGGGLLWLLPGGCGWDGPVDDAACGSRVATRLTARRIGFGGTAVLGDAPGSLAVGDLDLDGFDDLVVGLPTYDDDDGAAWIVFGAPDRFEGGADSLSGEVEAGRAIKVRGAAAVGGALGMSVSAPFDAGPAECVAFGAPGALADDPGAVHLHCR